MKVEMPHELPIDEARGRMKNLTTYWRRKYAVESRWTDDVARMSGSFLGITFEATLAIAAHTVILDGPDPGVLLRTQAIRYVNRKLQHYLTPRTMPAAGPYPPGAGLSAH